MLDRVAEELEFLLQQEARNRRLDVVRDDRRGGVGAVRRAEGVVAVDVAVGSELLGHFLARGLERRLLGLILLFRQVDALLRVVLLDLAVLGLVEARVLEKHDFTRLERLDDVVRRQTVRRELDFLPELSGELFRDGLEAEFRLVTLAFRTPEVAHENQAAALFQHILDGRKRRNDAGIVRNLAGAVLSHRHVEVHAHHYTLARQRHVAKSHLIHVIPLIFVRLSKGITGRSC